jgi:hypothetical protein
MVGLILWITLVDACCVLGDGEGVKAVNEHIKYRFDCDDVGDLTEYVGCKIKWTANYIRFTQPVLRQSYQDEFEREIERSTGTHAETGNVLVKCAEGAEPPGAEHSNFYT